MEKGTVYSASPAPAPKAPTPPPATIRPDFRPWIIMGGLLAVLAIAAIVWRPRPTSNQAVIPPSIFPTSAPATNPTPVPAIKPNDSTPGWKTYTDSKNTFTFNYPPEYKLTPYSESTFAGAQLNFSQSASTASSSADITLKIISLPNSAKTAKAFANDQMSLENVTVLNSIKFAGQDAFEIPLVAQWGRGKIIFFQLGHTVYRVSSILAAPLNHIPGYEATVNKIFSSLVLLNPDERSK
jgi:hypothetical protein